MSKQQYPITVVFHGYGHVRLSSGMLIIGEHASKQVGQRGKIPNWRRRGLGVETWGPVRGKSQNAGEYFLASGTSAVQ
jgi:hypothetical protein